MNTLQPPTPFPLPPSPYALIPAMTAADVARVEQIEQFLLTQPQTALDTQHHFHAGVYARTIMIPAGAVITGALIKIPTLLVFSGDATVFIGGELQRVQGYRVIPALGQRKQLFMAHTDTWLTMLFASESTSVEAAENQFTDQADRLLSRTVGQNLIFQGVME